MLQCLMIRVSAKKAENDLDCQPATASSRAAVSIAKVTICHKNTFVSRLYLEIPTRHRTLCIVRKLTAEPFAWKTDASRAGRARQFEAEGHRPSCRLWQVWSKKVLMYWKSAAFKIRLVLAGFYSTNCCFKSIKCQQIVTISRSPK